MSDIVCLSRQIKVDILSSIIMNSQKVQQNQNISAEHKIFQRIYDRKFINQAAVGLAEKRRIVASQSKPDKKQFDILHEAQGKLKKKSKSIGSLLPQIKQIEVIAKSEKQSQTKGLSSSLSKLDVYLSQKHTKRSDNFNLVFVTQSTSVVPDRVINEKFNQLIGINSDNQPKNLRALLSLTGGFQISEQSKQQGIGKQKKQLQQIVKKMIQQHHANEQQKHNKIEADNSESQEQLSQLSEVVKESVKYDKNIDWILKECRRYDKKFRMKKKKRVKGSKSKSKDIKIQAA